MDRVAAYRILCQVLERWRTASFADLTAKIGTTSVEEISGPASVLYTVETQIYWSDPKCHTIIVRGRIDDQSTFRFSPLEEQISIKDPDKL
jgi:hypothetical protein